ncbi:MAG: hypothetical protein K0R34_1721 [Herbinix sp.]|jgi:2-iminobutanoate/2-iminopropanoate deaminase|nr:hypothetical protein [Herbinix sp.]
MFKVIQTEKAPAAIGPYSQALINGNMMYSSGQLPINPEDGQMVEGNITEQTTQVMKNIAAILEQAGANFDQVIKTTCFLKNMGDFAAFNEVYGNYFTGRPARSTVEVARLPKDALCEVEIIALLSE